MKPWQQYSFAEMQQMGEINRRFVRTDSSKRFCSSCTQKNLRFYYHEVVKGGRIGSFYYSCSHCTKCGHATGACLSLTFVYNDPFEKLSPSEYGEMEKNGWFDRLEGLWESRVLPQEFVMIIDKQVKREKRAR